MYCDIPHAYFEFSWFLIFRKKINASFGIIYITEQNLASTRHRINMSTAQEPDYCCLMALRCLATLQKQKQNTGNGKTEKWSEIFVSLLQWTPMLFIKVLPRFQHGRGPSQLQYFSCEYLISLTGTHKIGLSIHLTFEPYIVKLPAPSYQVI